MDGYAVTWAREFRYDAARARYLNRELDPEALEEGDLVALSEVWTDYDGDSSYGDFELAGDPLMPSDLRSYESGVALKDPWDESSGIASSGIESSGIEYYHADLIGTTRGTTNHLGAPAIGASGSPVTYTAFGERLDSDDHLRYGYAGSWGYQAHDVPNGDPVQFLHVGWRYYDPSTGRFLQRDPIGIGGGLNVYTYAENISTLLVDPSGLQSLGTPPGIWALIQAELQLGRCVTLLYKGRKYTVIGIQTVRHGKETFIRLSTDKGVINLLTTEGHKISTKIVQTSEGIVIDATSKGRVCGATGAEVIPLFIALIWRRYAHRSNRRTQMPV
ncbi:MAG: hypothetical protein HS102_12170 [Planctomycetia bacterium]|nr:hypothetical protein [Planctomycetia bacterium]